MNRTEKADEVEVLKTQFSKSQIAIVADYKGLPVSAMSDLRRKLFQKQSHFKVVKNRLAKIAVKGSPAEVLTELFKGTTAVALTETDAPGASKVLTEFAKANEQLKIKGALLDGKLLKVKEIETLANLPTREELVAKMLGSLQAPMTNLVSVLSQLPRQLVTVLAAVKDQKEKTA